MDRGKRKSLMEVGSCFFQRNVVVVAVGVFFSLVVVAAVGDIDPNDLAILTQFRKNMANSELLPWDQSNDPCGNPGWKYINCQGDRVTQIQVAGLQLSGPLAQNFNQLSMLKNIGLQKNKFSGPLPTFSGLSNLQFAYLDYNMFDSIPADFFDGLDSLQVLALDNNNFNASTGWQFPTQLQNSIQLTNLSCMSCNLAGPLPSFLGELPSLTVLKLSGNSLNGEIPASLNGKMLQILWLNNQNGGGLTGPIDVVATMTSLTSLWLYGNQFTGTIPEGIGNLTSLKNLNINGNKLVGTIPESLVDMDLQKLDLNNNLLLMWLSLIHISNKILLFKITICPTQLQIED